MREKKNYQKIRRKSSKEENKLIFSCYELQFIILFLLFFHYIAKKCEKIHQITQENKKKIDSIGVYLPNSAPKTADISQLSKPKHRFRYK